MGWSAIEEEEEYCLIHKNLKTFLDRGSHVC
jgi:hypothetical protein